MSCSIVGGAYNWGWPASTALGVPDPLLGVSKPSPTCVLSSVVAVTLGQSAPSAPVPAEVRRGGDGDAVPALATPGGSVGEQLGVVEGVLELGL